MKAVRLVVPVLALLAACKKEVPAPVYESVPVTRRDIVVSAQAAGAINPDTIVEVKSKASGEILDIAVETGEVVRRGTLLVRVDQRVPRNNMATAQASLDVSKATLANAESQLKRTQQLFDEKVSTQQELDNAKLVVQQNRADTLRNHIALETAKNAMEDTEVRSPITGTIIKKNVERGTVISSPTSDVGGGTVLLTMADLSLVQVKTFVDETDIGKIRPGLSADVTVAAFPNRPFKGEVLKIEPQADTIQNVTMFPVLIRIDNKDGLLKPGMNADVKVAVGQREGVLAVPNAALRTEKDVVSAGGVLGIPEADLKVMLDEARKASQPAQTAGDTGATRDLNRGNDTAQRGNAGAGNMGQRGAQSGDSGAGRRGSMRGDSSGRGGNGQAVAGRGGNGQMGNGQMGNGQGGAGRGGMSGGRGGRGRGGRSGSDALFGGRYIVFTMRGGKPTPVYIQTGLTDLDYSEVRSGLTETDSVLMLPSASFVQSQQQMQQRMSQNAGLPGQSNTNAAGRSGATPAAGGAGGGGAGGGRGPGGNR